MSRELLQCSQGVGALQAMGPWLGLLPVPPPLPEQSWAPARAGKPQGATKSSATAVPPLGGGHSGPVPAQDSKGITVLCKCSCFRSQKPCALVIYFFKYFPLSLDRRELSVCGQGQGRCFLLHPQRLSPTHSDHLDWQVRLASSQDRE